MSTKTEITNLPVITGEDLAAQDRERRKALDTSKYNKQQ